MSDCDALANCEYQYKQQSSCKCNDDVSKLTTSPSDSKTKAECTILCESDPNCNIAVWDKVTNQCDLMGSCELMTFEMESDKVCITPSVIVEPNQAANKCTIKEGIKHS